LKKNFLFIITVSALITFVLQGCLKDKGIVPLPPETHCDSLNVSYNLDVKPIVNTNCAITGCHLPGGIGPGNFSSYDVFSGVSQTVAIRIQLPFSDTHHMPQGGVLPPEDIEKLLCWIENGAKNN